MGREQNRIVIKVGTSTLTDELGRSDPRSFERLACVLSDLQDMGYEVILVSSGAVAVGSYTLYGAAGPVDIPRKQAAAAVGQSRILHWYEKFFSHYGKTIAQILLQGKDMEQEETRESLRNTFRALLERHVIPIVNENDAVGDTEVASREHLFWDNDMLFAAVAILCKARWLVILSDIDGLYDADPHLYPDAKPICRVEQMDESLYSLAGAAGSRRGTGGMRTKLQAAALATSQGIDTSIIHGKTPEMLHKIVTGQRVGTLFVGNRC